MGNLYRLSLSRQMIYDGMAPPLGHPWRGRIHRSIAMKKYGQFKAIWLVLFIPLVIVAALWTNASANRSPVLAAGKAQRIQTRAATAQNKPSPSIRLLDRRGSSGKVSAPLISASKRHPEAKGAVTK